MSEDDKGLGAHTNELVALIVAYAKQETLVPIRNLGRYVAFGALGAVLFAVGGALLALTALRAIQYETSPHLAGELSWLPYLAAAALAAVGVAWAAIRILKGDKAVGR